LRPIKNLFIYLLPTLASAIIPIITLPIFTKVLTVEDYGLYALCLVYATFITGLSNFGLTIGYERNFFENNTKEEQGELLFSILLFVTIAFIFFGIITFILQVKLSILIFGDNKHGNIILLSFCATGIGSLKTYYLTYFKNTNNAKLYSWYSIDEVILNTIISLVLVVYFKIGVIGLIIGQFLGSSLILCLLTIRFVKLLPFSISKNKLISCIKLSLPLTPRIFFGIIGNQFDKYMINLLGSVAGVGVYNLGQKLSQVVFNFISALQNVFTPHVYRIMFNNNKTGGDEIGKYLTIPFFLSGLATLLMSLFSEEAIIFLTPNSFHGAIDITSILSLLYFFYFFGKQPQLVFAKKTSITSYLTIISIVINIIINIPFIRYFGVEGAAYGTLLAGIISVCINFYYSQKYYKINWENNKILVVIICVLVFTIINILIRKADVYYYFRLTTKLFFIFLYVLIANAVSIYNKKHITEIKKLIISIIK
jgi:O-antigen/teichoic acid export membrane protein